MNFYKKLSPPLKASFWFMVSSVIQKGISLLSTPIFTRLLTTEQYGVYSVYQSWYSIIIIFTTLNLYSGVYNNGMTKWPDKRKEYTSSLLGLSTVVTAFVFVVYLVGKSFWNSFFGLSDIFVYAIFVEALFVPAFNFWAASQRYDYKYQKLVCISAIMGLVSPLLGVIAVINTDYKAEARVLSYALVQICVGLVFYIYIMWKGKHPCIREYWKFALGFNIPLIPHYLSQTVLNQADRIMISNMVGSSEAAIYSVAYSISMMFTIVTNAINNSFIPYTYKSLKERNYKSLKINANFLALLLTVGCLVAMAFGPEIIRIFAAPEYYDARKIIPPVATALIFSFMTSFFCNVEFYFEKTKFIMVASSSAAIMNIVLNYYFIAIWGYQAAAYTTLICYIFLMLAHYFAYRNITKTERQKDKHFPIKLYSDNRLLLTGVISIILMVFMILIYDIPWLRYSLIGIIVIISIIKRKTILRQIKSIRGDTK